MILTKDEIKLTLGEKANTKLESMRQELAESLFTQLTEENFFVFNKEEKDVVGGPFGSKAKAQAFIDEMDDKANLVVMPEKQVEKILSK